LAVREARAYARGTVIDREQMMTSIMARFSLQGRRALVTGGSLSIGRAIALGLAEAGAAVAIQHCEAADAGFGRAGAAMRTTEELRAHGVPAHAIESDFRQAGAGTRTVEAATAALGGIDILVVAASIQFREPFETTPPAHVAEQTAVNFTESRAPIRAARRAGQQPGARTCRHRAQSLAPPGCRGLAAHPSRDQPDGSRRRAGRDGRRGPAAVLGRGQLYRRR
jgi:NAD(P)-dependent dehydrogenase (short-subunit alcohol dehydrogenase family)